MDTHIVNNSVYTDAQFALDTARKVAVEKGATDAEEIVADAEKFAAFLKAQVA